jgi:hypothetical protein
MTAQEKAKELVEKMYVKYEPKIEDKGGIYYFNMSFDIAKQSALIAVDEILENSHTSVFTNYWEEVKQLITQL